MDIRKNFLIKRVVKQWNRPPREVVGLHSLGIFKGYADVAFRDMA